MARQPDIIAEIAAGVRRSSPKRWHQRIAGEHEATLKAIADAYEAGQFGNRKRPAAEAIAATLKARGIADIGWNGVLSWLESL